MRIDVKDDPARKKNRKASSVQNLASGLLEFAMTII
jgi:hypothetical protein